MDSAGGGNLGKAAEQLLNEINELNQDQGSQKTGGQAFAQVMDAQQAGGVQQVEGVAEAQQVQGTNQISGVQPKPSAVSVIKVAQMGGPTSIQAVGATQKSRNVKSLRLLQDLVSGQDKMGKIVDMAMSGKQFDSQQLLALQASMYQFSQEMELTSKLVQTFQQDLKQTLQTQV